ncbi:MAG: NAD-dependent deacylase [Phycisphaerales bacterium]
MTGALPTIPQEMVRAFAEAEHVCVLTGAGISAESGLPTFRDKMTGLWAKYDPVSLATPEAYDRDPDLVTRWYDFRVGEGGKHRPNPGHHALARYERWQRSRGRRFTLLTQNVDGFHQDAGSQDVVELHGTIRTWRCVRCSSPHRHTGEPFPEYPPRCEHCAAGTLRPNVVWFGEMLPEDAIERAHEAIGSCDVFVSIGTSGLVQPAASFADAAASRGARVFEVNLEPTPLTLRADASVHTPSGVALPRLVEMVVTTTDERGEPE